MEAAIARSKAATLLAPWETSFASYLVASRIRRAETAVSGGGVLLPAYVIYKAVVLDAARYEEYKTLASATVAAAGGRYLVRGGDFEVLEGEVPPGRTVVLEFPSRQAVLDWYSAQGYAAARKVREGAAKATMYVVDGI